MHWRRKWQPTPVLNLLFNVFPFANVCACAQSCLTVCDPMDCSPPGSLSMEFSKQEYWSELPFPNPGDLPNPGIESRSPTLQTDSLPPEPQGKPKNTGVDSLSLLQWIFLTQELNQGLLHCRRILYQMNYQGNPNDFKSNQINPR